MPCPCNKVPIWVEDSIVLCDLAHDIIFGQVRLHEFGSKALQDLKCCSLLPADLVRSRRLMGLFVAKRTDRSGEVREAGNGHFPGAAILIEFV